MTVAAARLRVVSNHEPAAVAVPGAARATLTVELGHSSLTGPRPRNEDFCGAVTPEGAELQSKGLLAAVADGVGGHANGREAAEYVVRGLLADYYATPDTWSVATALDKVLEALNRWLIASARHSRENAGMATTLSAVSLRGARYVTVHVGDSRIYLLRDGELRRLTTDHVWDHPELTNVLKRAIGLDDNLAVDYSDGELRAGDMFALMSDGVWNALKDSRIADVLLGTPDPQAAAEALTRVAIGNGAQDNCTAMVLKVLGVPAANLRDSLAGESQLPLPPRLRVGDDLDGLRVDALLHESRVTLLYRVTRLASGEQLVMKTLHNGADGEACAALIHEEWIARRVTAHYFPQVVTHDARAHLYYLMSWHEGATLAAQLARGHRYSPAETVQTGIRLLKAVAALHRLSIIHRDIKPENLHTGSDGRLRVLDLGVAASDGNDFSEINNPGTPSYMAPELLAGEGASESTDLYACGVTLYHLLTRKYPYGEVEPFQHPKFGDPLPPTRYRPDIPGWLEAVLLKACARDAKDRFETAEEFLLALERGAARPLAAPRRMPLAQRDPQLLLKLIAAGSLIANLLLLYLLIAR
ncbi:MAG: bifunctional protein-serine/threonine kinase/phosphatase [Candidatus Methylophosphatis roskildensis]